MNNKLTKEEKERMQQEKRQKKYNETHKTINGIIHKLCSDCKDWLPMTESYYPNKSNKIDGHNPYCKECTKNRSRKWTSENEEKARESNIKSAKKCNEMYKAKRRIDKQKPERKTVYRTWQRNNKDKIKQYTFYREMNKTHTISDDEWISCKEYFDYSCAYCGTSEDLHKEIHKQQLHKEHVINEGANDLSNCVPACKACNSRKKTLSLEEWFNTNDVGFDTNRLNKLNKWLTEDYKRYIKVKISR